MEARVAKLEELAEKTGERLTRIQVRMEALATKEDVARMEGKIADAKASIVMRVVSAVLLVQLLPALLKKFGL